MNSISLTYS